MRCSGGQVVVARAKCGLDLGGTTHRLNCAREFGKYRVARGVEDTAPVLGEQLIEDLTMSAQNFDSALLGLTHHAAITDDVGHHDRRQPPLKRGWMTACGSRLILH